MQGEMGTRVGEACGQALTSRGAAQTGSVSSAITVADKEGIIQTSPCRGLAACAASGRV